MRSTLLLPALLAAAPAAAQPLPAVHAPPFVIFSPDSNTGGFGEAVAGVPDASGDGRGDLLIGAETEASGAGQAHVFSGATGALLRTLLSPNPETSGFGGRFGNAVAGVPDADNDGRGDLLVGAWWEDVGPFTDAGRVYLFSGASGALLHTLLSPNPQSGTASMPVGYGDAVAGVPDADGDGRGDLLVGAYREDVGAVVDAGRAYLYSGSTGELLYEVVSPVIQGHANFGDAVAGVPDVDGDGRGELLVGASGAFLGRVYLYSGATGALLHTFAPPSPQASASFGSAVAGVDDTHGDGRGDVLIGAYLQDVTTGGATYENAGQAYLFSGTTGTLLSTLTSHNPEVEGYFGWSVTGIPDVDGDGRGDLGIGAQSEDAQGLNRAGRAYVFSGATGDRLFTLVAPDAVVQRRFGFSVAGMPDADGDGRGDGVVGVNVGSRAYLFRSAGHVTGAWATDDAPTSETTTTPEPGVPLAFALRMPQPNPFADAVTLRLSLPAATTVRAEAFDLLGRRVAVLAGGPMAAGEHALRWEAGALPPGVYVVRVGTGGGHTAAQRVTLAR